MKGTASGYVTAAIFLALVGVGIAYESRTMDLLLALAWLPLLGFLAIHELRQLRRPNETAAMRGGKPVTWSEKVTRWFYGG